MATAATAGAAATYDGRKPSREPACKNCGSGPLLESEIARGLCPDCRPKASPRVYTRCQLCSVILGLDDDTGRGLCVDCQQRPEARRLGPDGRPNTPRAATPTPAAPTKPIDQARAFTPAEKSLIKHMHHVLSPVDLLKILNDRLQADLGAGVVLYTLEQLHTETSTLQQSERATDWASLRQVLAVARRCGVLEQITPQVIDDFAVVFQLSSAQVMNLRDVIRSAKEGR